MPNQEVSPEPRFAELAGRRQSAFREVNDELAKLTGSLVAYKLFICECADMNCAEALEITEAEYEHVRAEGIRFVVLPGHQLSEVERVVDGNGRFLVVEKLGAAAEVTLDANGQAS